MCQDRCENSSKYFASATPYCMGHILGDINIKVGIIKFSNSQWGDDVEGMKNDMTKFYG